MNIELIKKQKISSDFLIIRKVKIMKKTIKRVLGTGIVFGITIGLLHGGYSRFVNPGRDAVSSMKESLEVNNTVTQKEAQEDLTYLM